MDDQELIERLETLVTYRMLSGCEIDDHLHNKAYDVGSWSVGLRADELCRLIDLAKRGLDAQA